ncbi:Uncharacterized protein DAT39_000219 [Clarias magur]|uniref:Uncharacterized protein n=1 Tax=Clarias magur TaxID=1594786 RepID=A0A8J4XHB0_CLAMG|nr:Uncharacterized protein DAT39_000219 [Clarias magur]
MGHTELRWSSQPCCSEDRSCALLTRDQYQVSFILLALECKGLDQPFHGKHSFYYGLSDADLKNADEAGSIVVICFMRNRLELSREQGQVQHARLCLPTLSILA